MALDSRIISESGSKKIFWMIAMEMTKMMQMKMDIMTQMMEYWEDLENLVRKQILIYVQQI